MEKINNVSIGIQARSTSERFPKKIFELIGDKPMLQHVIDACSSAARYCNRFSLKNRAHVSVNLLIPEGDEIINEISAGRIKFDINNKEPEFNLFEGPEEDVLTRYVKMSKVLGSDYVVRITADCPLIPPYLIHKTITNTIMAKHDYCSNVELIKNGNPVRLSIDGHDCEAMTVKVLDWMDFLAKGKDREHVTTLFRREKPVWANRGFMVDFADFCDMKLSVDTKDELMEVRRHYEKIKDFIVAAESFGGKSGVHRI